MKIPQLVNKINRAIFLPTIQRDFVWLKNPKKEKIEKFFDSIMQDYPIGQVILWSYNTTKGKKGSKFNGYKFSNKYYINQSNIQDQEPSISSTEINYVIDGQQRLTALYIGLKGCRINKKDQTEYLYMNALYNNTIEGEQDEGYKIKYQFKFKTEIDVKNENQKLDNYWVRLSDLFSVNGAGADIFQTPREFKDFIGFKEIAKKISEDKADLISEKIAELHTKIINTDFDIKTLNNMSLDKTVDVFIRLNDGGVPLEKSDLMLSFITNIDNNFRNKITKLTEELKFGTILNKDFFLKASLTILTDIEPKFVIANFKKKTVKDIFDNFENISNAIKYTENMLSRYGFDHTNIPSRNALIPIVYFCYAKKLGKNSCGEVATKDIVKHFEIINWFCKASISGLFSGSSDSMLKQIKDELKKENFDFSKIKAVGKQIDKENIEKIVQKNGYGKPLLPIIINFCTSGYLKTTKASMQYHQDHIISQDECWNLGLKAKDIHSIGNIQILPAGANLQKTNKELKKWLDGQSLDKKLLLIPANYLDMTPLEFIEARKNLITIFLCKAFGVAI